MDKEQKFFDDNERMKSRLPKSATKREAIRRFRQDLWDAIDNGTPVSIVELSKKYGLSK